MFAVVYSWRLKPGKEAEFQKAWATRTDEIKEQMGGLGARLHRGEDGSWIAYTQWQNRAAYETAGTTSQRPSLAQKIMIEATESVETLFCMDVVEDKLTRPNSH